MASPLVYSGLLDNLGLKTFFRIHLLEPPVLVVPSQLVFTLLSHIDLANTITYNLRSYATFTESV